MCENARKAGAKESDGLLRGSCHAAAFKTGSSRAALLKFP